MGSRVFANDDEYKSRRTSNSQENEKKSFKSEENSKGSLYLVEENKSSSANSESRNIHP